MTEFNVKHIFLMLCYVVQYLVLVLAPQVLVLVLETCICIGTCTYPLIN